MKGVAFGRDVHATRAEVGCPAAAQPLDRRVETVEWWGQPEWWQGGSPEEAAQDSAGGLRGVPLG